MNQNFLLMEKILNLRSNRHYVVSQDISTENLFSVHP